jgi:hypothetical protein
LRETHTAREETKSHGISTPGNGELSKTPSLKFLVKLTRFFDLDTHGIKQRADRGGNSILGTTGSFRGRGQSS